MKSTFQTDFHKKYVLEHTTAQMYEGDKALCLRSEMSLLGR